MQLQSASFPCCRPGSVSTPIPALRHQPAPFGAGGGKGPRCSPLNHLPLLDEDGGMLHGRWVSSSRGRLAEAGFAGCKDSCELLQDLTFWAMYGGQQESLICCDVCPSFSSGALQQWDLFKGTTLEAQSKCVLTINKKNKYTHTPGG